MVVRRRSLRLSAVLFSSLFAVLGCSTDDKTSRQTTADGGLDVAGDTSAEVGRDTGVVEPAGDRGPGRLIDVQRARERTNLQLDLEPHNSVKITARGPGFSTSVFEVSMTYVSQTLWGSEWRHQAAIYLPETIHPEAPEGAFVVVPGATKNPVSDVSKSAVYRNNYAAAIAGGLGIPAMVVPNLPGPIDLSNGPDAWQSAAPERCTAGSVPSNRYTPCLLAILRETGDLEADPFRYLAFAWMRSVTAAVEAGGRLGDTDWPDEPPPSFEPKRALLLGDGGQAVGARMAAAVDVRIDGAFGNADFAQIDDLLDRLNDRWSSDTGWFRRAGQFRQWLDSEVGARWQGAVDPAEWSELLEGLSFVNARGTNDPRFPLGSGRYLADAFPSETASVTAPNYGAGVGSADHLVAWRAFVAHTYLDRPWDAVAIDAQETQGNISVEATITGRSEVSGSTIHSIQQQREADDRDYRDAVWQSAAMEKQDGSWKGAVAPIVDNHAVFGRVESSMEVPTVLEEPATWSMAPTWSSRAVFFE